MQTKIRFNISELGWAVDVELMPRIVPMLICVQQFIKDFDFTCV